MAAAGDHGGGKFGLRGMTADSDDAAHPFRDDRAHHCEMMPPIRGVVVGGLI
jgi:hypothetical protein